MKKKQKKNYNQSTIWLVICLRFKQPINGHCFECPFSKTKKTKTNIDYLRNESKMAQYQNWSRNVKRKIVYQKINVKNKYL